MGRSRLFDAGAVLALTAITACGHADVGREQGAVEIDGSSTVFLLTEAVAEEFMIETGGTAQVTVASSGTGGGFRRFCAGNILIADASRSIAPVEKEACAATGIDYLEIPVAYDGISIVVNPSNDFVDCLTVDELRAIWKPGSRVVNWSDVRPTWPRRPVRLYGPGTNSGTFDYFTEAINGQTGASRADYTASENDNVLVQGAAGDPDALGYFGYAYYVENESRLGLVGVDSGEGCVLPDPRTIEGGTYAPLSRPLYLYVNREALADPTTRQFIEFYLDSAPALAVEVGYVPLAQDRYSAVRAEVARVSDAS